MFTFWIVIFNSTKTNDLRNNMRSSTDNRPTGKQVPTNNSYINAANGIRVGAVTRIEGLNNQLNGVNDIINSLESPHELIRIGKKYDKPKPPQPRPTNNNNNNGVSRLPKTKLVDRLSSQENNINNNNTRISNNKNRISNGSSGNVIVVNKRPIVTRNLVNSRPSLAVKSIEDNTVSITPDLRKLLRPTVTKINEDKKKSSLAQQQQQQNDGAEDINGPYNFRKLLRPAGYLPTESLRKRKGGGLACNGAPVVKDKVPGKHVKRRAPLAPNPSSKIVVSRK